MAGRFLVPSVSPNASYTDIANNMLYDMSEIPIPHWDNVDEDTLFVPGKWDINFVRKFMLTVGPISSIF